MQLIYKHKNKILVAIMVLMLIPFIFNIGLESDEPFTMGLIKNGYVSIANLTAMDAHPPLYYWALKAFLSIATFWTSNIFIKIIFARLLSLIFSLLTLFYLIKVLNILNLHHNKYVVSFIFFMCPLVYGREGIASGIRMYSLGAMLCMMCIYYLLLYRKDSKLKYLIITCLTATLVLYTQYMIGIIAGSYILTELIILFFNKEYKSVTKLLIAGIVSLILYMPWIPKLIIQFSSQSLGKHVDVDINYVFVYYIVIAFLAMMVVLSDKLNLSLDTRIILYVNLILSVLILMINIKFNPYSIAIRYTSIALIMNYVIVGIILIYNFDKSFAIKVLLAIFAILLINIDIENEIPSQRDSMLIPSINFYHEFNSIKHVKSNVIDDDKYHLNSYFWDSGGGNAIYLDSINKKLHYNQPLDVYAPIGNGNITLFKKVFPNVENYSARRWW